MRTVADLMAEHNRPVHWIDPLASVFEALEHMNRENIGSLLVQIDGYIVGIVSERDYVRKVILDHHASKQTKVSEIMTRDVISVHPEDDVMKCIELMKEHNVRHLPVVVEGKPVGIISLRDLFIDVVDRYEHRLTAIN